MSSSPVDSRFADIDWLGMRFLSRSPTDSSIVRTSPEVLPRASACVNVNLHAAPFRYGKPPSSGRSSTAAARNASLPFFSCCLTICSKDRSSSFLVVADPKRTSGTLARVADSGVLTDGASQSGPMGGTSPSCFARVQGGRRVDLMPTYEAAETARTLPSGFAPL